jgi:hypothetical protein
MHTKEYDKTTYAIAHNGADIIHAIIVEPGSALSTGQEYLEEFAEWGVWEARLTEMGYDVSSLEPPSLETPKANVESPSKVKSRKEFPVKPSPEEPEVS